MESDALYYGDCLDWMQRWDDQSVDLIYLDPPFNSKSDYNVLYSADGAGDAQYRAFSDTWSWDGAAAERFDRISNAVAMASHAAIVGLHEALGESGMLAYLTYMAERLEQMKRLLKPAGSIYLHCDPTASHYLKVVMDGIFMHRNFRSEIVWQRTSSRNDANRWGAVHDTILFYSKGDNFCWNATFQPHNEEYVKKFYRHKDARGTYRQDHIIRTASMGERPNLAYEYKGYTPRWGWRTVREKLKDLDRDNRIEWSTSGRPYLKRYLHEQAGTPVRDVITDIPPISGHAKENMGYPTQKPITLLERIIEASSNKGDIVLDPFCGCGTAIDAARRLGRRWVGIDISSFAIDMIRERRLKDIRVQAYGIPADFAGAQKLAQERPFAFESWAVMRLPGFAPNTKQHGDGGVDGRATLAVPPDDGSSKLALAQVKGGKFQLSHFRDFNHVVDRDKAAWGCFVTLNPSSKNGSCRG